MYKIGDKVRLSSMQTAWGHGHVDMGMVGVITYVALVPVYVLYSTLHYDKGQAVDRTYYVSWNPAVKEGGWRGAECDLVPAEAACSDSVPCPPSLKR